MGRFLAVSRRLAILAAIAAATIWFVRDAVLPRLVRDAVARGLREAGAEPLRLEVRSVGLRRAELGPLVVDAGETFRASAIVADYTPGSLRRGAVSALRIEGAELDCDLRDGSLDLDRIKLPSSPGAFPFDSLELPGARLAVRTSNGTARVLLDVIVTNPSATRTDVALSAQGPGLVLDGSAAIDWKNLGGSLQARRLEVDTAALDLRPPGVPGLRCALTGSVAAAAGATHATFDAAFGGAVVAALPDPGPVALHGAAMRVEGTVDGLRELGRLEASLSVASMAVAGTDCGGAALAAVRAGEDLAFELTLTNRWLSCGPVTGRVASVFAPAGATNGAPVRRPDPVRIVAAAHGIVAPARGAGAFAVGGVDADLSMSASAASPSMAASLAVRDAEMRAGTNVIAVRSAALDVSGSVSGLCATARIEGARAGADEIPPVLAAAAWTGSTASGTAAIGATADGPVRAAWSATNGPAGWAWNVAVDEFAPGGIPWLVAPVRRATGGAVSGRFAVEAGGTLGAADARARLRLADAGFAGAEGTVEGVDGVLEFESLAPLRSRGDQRFEVRRVTAGRVRLEEGRVACRIEDGETILFESTEWTWCGGRVRTSAFRMRAADAAFGVTLFAERVRVAEVLDLIFGRRVEGSGVLDGRIPVRVRMRPVPGVAFGDGYLYAAEGGRLRIKDRELLKSTFAGREPESLKDRIAKPVQEGIVASLEDFEYTTFVVRLAPGRGGRPAGRMELSGRGVKREGLPLRLTINFAEEGLEGDTPDR